MSFLGPVGSLIPVKCASQLTSSGGRQVSFQDTLGKRKAFLGNVRARQWDVEIGLAKPSELSGLRWLAENVHSPMVWYAPDAVVGNILTPQQTDFSSDTHSGLEGPLVEVEPGLWVKSVMGNVQNFSLPWRDSSLDPVPVPADRPVTISSWLRGGNVGSDEAQISVIWRNVQGVAVETVSTRFPGTSVLTRRSVTLTPPPGAVQFTLQIWCDQAAGVAATLTDRLLPYAPGRGAKRVVVHGLTDAVLRATEQQQLGSLSFSVTEVG